MKRKYFSVMLMAAMTVASTSMVTSCKDYDDDINGLRTEITNNATTLTALVNEKVNNLTTELNTLKSQQTALETALENAQSTLDAAIKKAETDSKAYAEVQAAAAQKAAIEAAKASLDDAVKTINAAIEAANKNISELNSKVTTNEEQIAGLLDADKKLEAAIIEAKAEAKTASDKALDAAQAAQKAADAAQATADGNATKLAEISEKLTKVESDLDGRVTILEKTVKDNAEQIAQNASDITAKFNEAHALIVANQNAIEELKGADAEMLKKINQNISDIQKLNADLVSMKTALEAEFNTAIAGINAQYTLLEGRVTANETAIQKAQADATQALTDAAANLQLIQAIQKELDKTNADSEVWKAINDNAENLTKQVGILGSQISNLKAELEGKINAKADQVKVDELETALKALQTKAGQNTTDITNLINNLNKYFGTVDFTKETESINKQIQDLKNKIGEVTDTDGTYTKSLQTQIDELTTQLNDYAKLSDFNNLKTKFTNLETKYNNLVKDYTGTLAELNDRVAQNNTTITNKLTDLEAQLSKLAGFAKQLKSLVFAPSAYYQGIETINVESYNYTGITGLLPYNEDEDQVEEEDAARKINGAKISVVPDVTADYYLNPSNANIDTDVNHFKFLVRNASYTRATDASKITPTKVEAENGLAKVTFKMKDADEIGKFSADGKVDVIALQYTYKSEDSKNDTTVTSDFAALKQYINKDFIINKVSAVGNVDKKDDANNVSSSKAGHLATTAAAAIHTDANGNYTAPTLEIEYDNDKGINLDQWINVHYTVDGEADKLWGGQTTVNKKGFKLAYSLLGYIAKGNDTNESAHANINGNILTVNGYKEETGRQIIGRTPLVRVSLVDENTGTTVASVGYIVVKIVDKPVTPVQVADIAPVTKDYTVACSGNILNNEQAITWEEVENKVLSTLGVSKAEFEANWVFDTKNINVNNQVVKIAKQYELENGEFKLVTATNDFGSVIATTDDKLGHQTNVLQWTVDNATAYTYFVTKGKTSKSIWVKFTPKKTTDKPVYVKLTWTPAAINKTPEATILDTADHKKTAAWHAANTNNPGWDQLHIQVGNATQPGETADYKSLVIASTFNKSVLDIVKDDIKANYPALANSTSTKVEFKFAPLAEQSHKSYTVDNKTYTIEVSDDYTVIKANKEAVAKIEPTNGTVTIENNDVTKAILNSYSNLTDLQNALTFTVKANVKTCAPAENLIKLNNNKFDVKVIKPIFVEGATIKGMQLNNYKSLTQDVTFEFKDFNGYTQAQFFANSNRNVKFFKFYGIESIEQDGTIQTDYSGKRQDINTNDIKVEYVHNKYLIPSLTTGVVTDMGKVKLEQVNQSRANDFNVWIPIKVTYKWGTLKTEIKLEVQAASAAAAKRH